MKEDDKRQAVRVDSRILFAAHLVSNDVFLGIEKDYDEGISLYNRPELADVRLFVGATAALSRLRDRDEDMAIFLQHIDAKLNTLLRKVDDSPTLLDKLTLQSVNLAGNGLAFWSAKSYTKGDLLEFYIVLPAEDTFIVCFGEVVDCLPEKNAGLKRNRISCSFRMVMDADREELIKYNFKQQSLALKRRRNQEE
jgi:hypothetical protein